MKRRFFWLLFAFLLLPATARALEPFAQFDSPRRRETKEDWRTWHGVTFLEMFGLKGSLWYAGFSGEVAIDKAGVIGDPIKLTSGLGLEEPRVVQVPETYFQYQVPRGPVFRLEASYYWHRFEGEEAVDFGEGDLVLEGVTIPEGTAFETDWDIMMGKLNLRITPYVVKVKDLVQIRVSLYGGSMYARWTLRFKTDPTLGLGNNGIIKDEMWATMGHIGPHLEVRIGPFAVYGWVTGMQFHRNELFANYYEAGGGVKYEPLPFVLIGAEMYFYRARLERDDQFRMDFTMYGPSVSLILRY